MKSPQKLSEFIKLFRNYLNEYAGQVYGNEHLRYTFNNICFGSSGDGNLWKYIEIKNKSMV